MFLKRWWSRFRDRWLRVWTIIRPGPETRRGVFWAAAVTVVAAACVGGLDLDSGFGLWIDIPFAFLVAGLGISLVALLTAFLLSILRHLPKLLFGVVIGACIFVSLVLPPSGFVFVPLAICFGAA